MDPTFGVKQEHLHYAIRKGCYAVIVDAVLKKIAVVLTTKGHYFLPGGGMEAGETEEECLKREVIEEIGYSVNLVSFIGTAQRYFITSQNEPILSEAVFYAAELVEQITAPIEEDHVLQWIRFDQVDVLFHEHQAWAVKRRLEQMGV